MKKRKKNILSKLLVIASTLISSNASSQQTFTVDCLAKFSTS